MHRFPSIFNAQPRVARKIKEEISEGGYDGSRRPPPWGARSHPAPTLAPTRDAHRAPTIRCIKTSGIFFIHRARHDALARPSKTPSSRPAEQSARVAFSDRVRVPSRARVHVLVAVRAPDHHGLGVGDLAGGDGDGLRDLRGGLGDGRHDFEISVLESADTTRDPHRVSKSTRIRAKRARIYLVEIIPFEVEITYVLEMLRIRFKGRAIVIRTFGTSRRPDARARARRAALIHTHADHVRHHPSFRASREDRRRHHRQGRQRQVHDDLAPARQQVRERARSIEPSRIFRERIAPHRANVARPLRARARLDDAARAIFR